MILLDYFRADRPLEKFKKYGISNDEKKINKLINDPDNIIDGFEKHQ